MNTCSIAKALLHNNGGLAERFKAAVLKTVEVRASAGSNPVSSATNELYELAVRTFLFMGLFWSSRSFQNDIRT